MYEYENIQQAEARAQNFIRLQLLNKLFDQLKPTFQRKQFRHNYTWKSILISPY